MSVPFGVGRRRPARRRPGDGRRPRRGHHVPGRRRPRRSAGMSDALPDGWEMVIGLEVHCELATETKLFCSCPNQLRRRAQRQHLPHLPRPAGLAAGAQRGRGRDGHAPRSGARVRREAVGLRPEELLLSGPAEGLPGLPVRPADQRARRTSTCRRASGSASPAPTSRRTPASSPTSAAAVASTTPTHSLVDYNRSGVPAGGDRVRGRHAHAATRPRSTPASCARSSSPPA